MAIPPAFSGKPPVGHSPAMSPSGNPGMVANALAKVREAVNILSTTLPDLVPGTDPWKAVYDAIGKLGKVAPEGAGSPGVQQTATRDMAQQQQQMAPMTAIMRSMAAGQPGLGAATTE